MKILFLILSLILPTLSEAASLKIAWVDNSTNETRFEIERSLTGATLTFALIASPPTNAVTYTDSGLLEGTDYSYRLRACNSAGCSPYTAVVSARTLVTIPATPGTPTVTPQ